LLFDQNLSYKIIKHLEHLFPTSTHVRKIGLDKADDLEIWQYAKENDFHIVTQDSDFNDINNLYGYPPKIIRLNTGNASSKRVIDLIVNRVKIIEGFLNDKNIGLLELS
jgi:predicted nuclease of predicted toxin-antitoxin system